MNKTFYVVLLLLAWVAGVRAQTGKLFNTDKMLSSSFALHVYQDHDGFIWISTRNGLNRYDGYNFKVFKKGNDGCEGMSSNYVNTVMQRSDKVLLVGNQRGVQAYYDDRFHDLTLYGYQGEKIMSFVDCIAETADGTVYIGTSNNGIYRLKNLTEAHRCKDLKEVRSVRKMMEDSSGWLWLLTERGGLLSTRKGQKKRWFNEGTMSSALTSICEDLNGNIYVGTNDKGVWVKEKHADKFQPLPSTADMHVTALYTARSGKVLVGFDGGGMAVMNPATGQLLMNPLYSHEVDLRHAKVNCFVEDKAGNLWVSMLQKGVLMQTEKPLGFEYAGYKQGDKNQVGDCCVTSTLIDSRGLTWVGTDSDGLYVLDANRRCLRHFDYPYTVLALAEDSQGRIWAGAYMRGLFVIDRSMNAPEHVDVAGLERLDVFDIAIDRQGFAWIATMGHGLIKYDMLTGKAEQFKSNEAAANDRKVNSLVNNYISQLTLSSDGQRLYIATTMGLCCYDIRKKSWTNTFGANALLYGNNVRTVAEAPGNILWVGTYDGLFRYDMKTRQTVKMTEDDGLPDNSIAALLADKAGNLWAATDHGLCQAELTTGEVKSCFYADDGLQSNEFSEGAIAQGLTGEIVLGGVGGVTWFNPQKIKQQTWNAEVLLTNLVVNGKDVAAGDKSGFFTVTDKPVLHSNRFSLAYRDNTFAIQLSTLTYGSPEQITYSYSVNNDGWTSLHPGQNELNFSLMPPGTYKFRVKATKNNQESKVKEFTVVVHSPWYRSTVAYLVYMAIIAALIYNFLRQRRQKYQDRLRMQEHKHAEELNEAKIKFFMNISHEIRTPMTLIVAPLMTLIKDDNDPKRVGAYMTIKRNAERILNLINQMMDLRKIEKGKMRMRMRETDIIGFVDDICRMFEYQAKAKNIKFEFIHQDEKINVWIDLSNFDKVVVNLLSNAFKYTPAGGHVEVTVKQDGNYITIDVKDNGEGIPQDMIDKIFERFYQSETRTNDRHFGTGIGLDLTNSLVLLHHGSITAKNNDEGGATFQVTLPLGCAHLKEDEKITQEEPKGNRDSIVNLLEESYQTLPKTEPANPAPATTQKGKRLSIVAVEDDNEIQQYLVNELSPYYKVKAYGNGQDALTAILKDVPDLVISDVMMPVMDGTTLCTRLRNNVNTNALPIVLLTAKSSDEDMLEGLETGADAYIVKPFNIEILKRTVLNLLDSRKIMRNKASGKESQEDKMEHIDMQTADDKLMERVMKVINANIGNDELNVDFIAREVGLSRVHFYRKMKDLTNQSPHNFIKNIRMKEAARLFDNGHQNINEVMYAMGFNNTSSFSTAFKAVYGISPRDYIKDKARETKPQ